MSATHQTPLEQARCWRLHEICRELQGLLKLRVRRGDAFAMMVERCDGEPIVCPKTGEEMTLKLSVGTLRRHYAQWQRNPRAEVFQRAYKGGKTKVPRELVHEIQRRATREGAEEFSSVIRSIKNDWIAGREVKGLGTWRDWWAANHPEHAMPPRAPDFPITDRSLYRYQPSNAEKEWGARGKAAALKQLPHMVRDTSTLAPGRLYVSDNVRLDLMVVDDMTGQVTEVHGYILMDWGTRYIPSFVLRPATAILAQDVDAMLARGLQTIGLRPDGHTYIMFERGTVACSPTTQNMLERASGDRIKILRTGMNGGTRWDGAAPDKASGHWMGKGVIESFMASLHRLLRELGAPGQRGSSFRRMPANLGWVGNKSNPVTDSLADQANKLARLQLHFGSRVKLNLPLLTFGQVNAIVREAIRIHNTRRDHGFQGFSQLTVRETAPGFWEDVA